MTDNFKETGAVGFARINLSRQPTAAEIQRGIDATMRDVVRRDARHNPQTVGASPSVTPVGAAPVVGPVTGGTGWRDYGPLQSPPGQDAIERIANALAGPVRGTRPKPKPEAEGK